MPEPIETAPYNREVEVRVSERRWVRAIFLPLASLTEDEVPCDQWQATTDKFPSCWSDGCCWSSNADGVMSLQPYEWREIA